MSCAPRTTFRVAAIVLAAALTLLSGAAPASAGCLKEYGRCGDCARDAMMDAIRNLSIRDAMDAYVDGADCDIDLLHCILYDNHHSYECGI
jgi:hypothetical protein